MLTLVNSDADQRSFLGTDARGDAALMHMRIIWKGREGMRISTDLLPPLGDSTYARRLAKQHAARMQETETGSAGELGEEDVPATPATSRTLEARQCPIGPRNQHRVPID